MSSDKHYDGWEERLRERARPFGWRELLWIVAKGVAIGAVAVLAGMVLWP